MLDINKDDIRRIEADWIKEHNYGIAYYSQYDKYHQSSTISIQTSSSQYALYFAPYNTNGLSEQVTCTFELQLKLYPNYVVTFQSIHPVLSHTTYEITDDHMRFLLRLISPVANAQNKYSGIVLSSTIYNPPVFNGIRFHLANFPEIANRNIVYYHPDDLIIKAYACARLYADFGDYELSIDRLLNNLFDLDNSLESKKLTHYANISRKDKNPINPSEFEVIRSTAYLFISFLAGHWCPTILTELFLNEKALNIILVPEESSFISPYFMWGTELMHSGKLTDLDISSIAHTIYELTNEKRTTKILPILLRWYFDCISAHSVFETCIMSCISLIETIYKSTTKCDIKTQIKNEDYSKVYLFFNERNIEHRIPHFWQDVKDFHTNFVGVRDTTEQSVLPLLRKIRNKLYHHEINDLDKLYSTHPTTRFRLILLAQQLAEETLLRYLGYTGECAKREGLQTHLYG
jgi:hypothetical protein